MNLFTAILRTGLILLTTLAAFVIYAMGCAPTYIDYEGNVRTA